MSSFRVWLTTLGALFGAACSLTTSVDGLTGGTAAGTGHNGPPGLFDGALPDGASGHVTDDGGPGPADSTIPGTGDDAAPTDSGAPSDTSIPPADAGDSAPPPFCAAHPGHVLCDDFDQSLQPWKDTTVNGSQGIDALSFTSAPNAYYATTTALPNTVVAQVERSRHFTTVPHAYHFEYSVRIDARDPSQSAALAAVEIFDWTTGQDDTISLTLYPGAAVAEEGYTSPGGGRLFKDYAFGRDLPNGTWMRVVSDVIFGASGARLTVTLDGAIVVANKLLMATTVTGQTDVFLGISYLQGPSSAWKVRYDDVIFDVN
jgi:hypothetical protein